MKPFARLHQFFGRTQLPVALMVALLQRSPTLPLARALTTVVAESPMGALLRGAFAAAVSLGGLHSLAGATVLSTTQASPVNVTVGTAITSVAFTVTNTINIASWKITGAIPAGLSLVAAENAATSLTAAGTLDATKTGSVSTTPVLTGTPTQAGSFTFNLQAYESPSLGGLASASFPFTVNVTGSAVVAAPTITMQPLSVNATGGGTVALVVSATNAVSYQWRKDGANLAGATASALVLSGVSAGSAGAYTVVVSNTGGSTTSSAANVTVAATTNFGRMINMSILTNLAAGSQFTVGTVLGGSGTSGPKSLLVRAVGPSLAQLGVGNPLSDPKLDFFSGTSVIASNDNWNGDAQISATASQLGAFPYVGTTSKDAAVVFSGNISPPAGYTVQVSGVGGSSGTVLAELYDATPSASVTAATPRLINLSVLKAISAGEVMTVGFVVRGETACTVLLRAVGPGLVQLGVGGVLPDPKISLFNSASAVIAENDNWGGNPQVANAASSVGAFNLGDPASKDAMMVITLPPGSYTVQVSGVANAAGQVVVEAYEVP